MDQCVGFSYWPDSSDCYFADHGAELQPSSGAVAGPGVCPKNQGTDRPVCRTEIPGNGFPGFSDKASNAAWPSGKQPQSLECWPKNRTGGYMACQQVATLEDTDHDWPGKCRGLVKHNGTFAQCAQNCKEDPFCPAWQTGMGGCWQGLGLDCFVRVDYTPLRAQRLQHGSVRVLWDLTGWQVVGLAKAFDNKHGYFRVREDAIAACRKVCYSDIRCQYWQYAPRYGCWVEDASQSYGPPWPLTTQWAYRSTPFALDCIAGEYIQHTCPPHLARPFAPRAHGELASCMRRGYALDPPDMPHQSRTTEEDADTCQERCRSTRGCAHFTFWPDGGCHLQDGEATKVLATDGRVVSGPASCGPRRPAAEEAPAQAAPVLRAPPPAAAQPINAEILVRIGGLSWNALDQARQQAMCKMLAQAMAKPLGVDPEALKARPQSKTGGRVLMQAGSQAFSGKATLLLAYVTNITAPDFRRIERTVNSRKFELTILETAHAISTSHGAPGGNSVRQFFQQLRMAGNATCKMKIDARQVHQLSRGRQRSSEGGPEDSGCGFVCQMWPFVVGLLLLILCLAGIGALVMGSRAKAKPKKKSRGVRLEGSQDPTDTDNSAASVATRSVGELDPFSPFTTASSQETRPLVGDFRPQPMSSAGFRDSLGARPMSTAGFSDAVGNQSVSAAGFRSGAGAQYPLAASRRKGGEFEV